MMRASIPAKMQQSSFFFPEIHYLVFKRQHKVPNSNNLYEMEIFFTYENNEKKQI